MGSSLGAEPSALEVLETAQPVGVSVREAGGGW